MKPVYGFDRVIRPDPGFKIKQAPACQMKCSGDRLEEGEAFREVAKMKTRVTSGWLALE